MTYDNELSGALFKNDKKNDKQPDYTGTCQIGNVEYKIAAWVRDSKAGKKYMSLRFENKDQEARQDPRPEPSPAETAGYGARPPDDFDDKIGF